MTGTDRKCVVFEQVEHREQSPVVVVPTQAEADLLVATLLVHGLEATSVMASAIPSIDWLEGFGVLVATDDARRARGLLEELGHRPVVEADPGRPRRDA